MRQGVLEPVVKILSLSRQPTRPNGKETSRSFVPAARPLSVEEDVRLQSLQLLASFANGTSDFSAARVRGAASHEPYMCR